jgi:hypothetical protein
MEPERDHDNFRRRDSATLRRLVVDGGQGILRVYRKSLCLKGDVRVTGVDLKARIDGLDRSLIHFATAGGAQHNGTMVAAGMAYRGAMSQDQIKARYERGPQERTWALINYLNSPCIVFAGQSVSRRELIQYIANRNGGVHFDETRDRLRPQVEARFVALDGFIDTVQLAEKDAGYFELLAIGQAIVAAPEVHTIIAPEDSPSPK